MSFLTDDHVSFTQSLINHVIIISPLHIYLGQNEEAFRLHIEYQEITNEKNHKNKSFGIFAEK